ETRVTPAAAAGCAHSPATAKTAKALVSRTVNGNTNQAEENDSPRYNDGVSKTDHTRGKIQELIPTPAAERPLSKEQRTFLSLLERVESLRESIDAEEAELDATLAFYAAEIFPKLVRVTALQKELVRDLA